MSFIAYFVMVAQVVMATGPSWSQDYKKEVIAKNLPRINALAFSPSGSHLAYGDESGAVRIWSLAAEKVAFEKTRLPAPSRVLSFSANGSRLAIACEDKGLGLWDYQTKQFRFLTMPGFCLAVGYSPTGEMLANSFSSHVAIWRSPRDVSAGQTIDVGGDVADLAFSADSRLLATCDSRGGVYLKQLKGCTVAGVEQVSDVASHDFGEQLGHIRFLDSEKVVVATISSVFVWDFRDHKILYRKDGLGHILALAVQPNSSSVFFSTFPKSLYHLDWQKEKLSNWEPDVHVTCLRIDQSGKFLAVGFGQPYRDFSSKRIGRVELWRLSEKVPQ